MDGMKSLITYLIMIVLGIISVVLIVGIGTTGTHDTDITNNTDLILNSSLNGTHYIYSGYLHSLGAFEVSNIIAYITVDSLDTSNRTVHVYNNGTLLGNFTAIGSVDGSTNMSTQYYYILPRYTGNLVSLTYEAKVNTGADVVVTSTRLGVIRYNSINRIIFGVVCILIAFFCVYYLSKEFN